MADFNPFHGLRYCPGNVPLADVLAPPYDVVKGAMRDELLSRNQYNVIGIELAARYGDQATDEQYAAAAELLKAWQEQNILRRDDPAFYIYEQEFTVPGTLIRKKRRGVLGALTLEEFGKGVQPHEHTLSGPKEDRLKLLRALHTNTSPIFGLFPDSDGWVSSVVDSVCTNDPHCQVTDAEGIAHRLWVLTDDESVNAIVAGFENETILIADGHHRYETALNYRNERRAAAEAEGRTWTGAEPENAVMMMCVATTDDGLIVLPTHRLVKNVDPEKLDGLLAAIEPYFEVQPIVGEGAEALMQHVMANEAMRIGVAIGSQRFGLKLKEGDAVRAAMDSTKSEPYNKLNVTILHRLILESLGIGTEELAAGQHVAYTIDAEEAVRKAATGECQAAFLLSPTPVAQVQEVAAAGDKMPQKSTYFYPKLVTGMVLRPLA